MYERTKGPATPCNTVQQRRKKVYVIFCQPDPISRHSRSLKLQLPIARRRTALVHRVESTAPGLSRGPDENLFGFTGQRRKGTELAREMGHTTKGVQCETASQAWAVVVEERKANESCAAFMFSAQRVFEPERIGTMRQGVTVGRREYLAIG
ncbi:hypothetical protein BC629DRAFT_1554539 [Irpex lacteus]|nr:hypothetical protein BC629DRAFT_1554539 [Irpex lacteus]